LLTFRVLLEQLAILIYFVLFPGIIVYVLFVLVPRHGLENERLNQAFGFLWSRFESRIYWWEIGSRPAIELGR
jgi:hypothetical protein